MKWIVTKTMTFMVDAPNETDAEFAANHLDEYDAFKVETRAEPDDGKAGK